MKAILMALVTAFVLLTPFANGQGSGYNITGLGITFDTQPDFSIVETLEYTLGEPVSSEVSYSLGEPVQMLAVSDGTADIPFSYFEANGSYEILIRPARPTNKIIIAFSSSNMIFKSDSVNHFFSELSFDDQVPSLNATLKLPEGFGIYRDSYLPKNAQASSDGRRVILSWHLVNTRDVLFSAKFEQLNRETNFWAITSIILVIIAVSVFIYFRKKSKQEFLSGFSQDEKKVIEYLGEKKMALQSDIEKEFKFSRAKMTRITMKLEQRRYLDKKKKGRTNRLTWKK